MVIAYLVFKSYPVLQGVLTGLVLLVCCLPVGRRWGSSLAAKFAAVARHSRVMVGVIFILSFATVAMLAARRGYPGAYVHDEFSYLLAADTFAEGRLTNPTPPAWKHFETMHVLVRPSYQSKYPPGQGLAMALGQVVFGHPIWGVWLTCALAAAAIYWALLAVVSRPWALAGGLVTCLHPQLLEWGQRYWGGAVATFGGALVLGATLRLCRAGLVPPSTPAGTSPALRSIALAVGIFVLAISRPFEGFVFVVVLAAFFGRAIWREYERRTLLTRLLLPAALVLVPGMLWIGYYNWRVTGKVTRLPYAEHHAVYGTSPLFIFQPPMERPKYNHDELLRFAKDQNYPYMRRDTKKGLAMGVVEGVSGLAISAFGNVSTLAVPLILLPWIVKTSWLMRRLLAVLAIFVAVLMLETYTYGHYAAPAAGVLAAIVCISLRWMNRLGHPVGPLLARISLSLAVLWSFFWWIGFFQWIPVKPDFKETRQPWYAWRSYVENEFLATREGKHLVLVRYAPTHMVHDEWVYNRADLGTAKVVWAREMRDNGELLAAFPDRKVWLMEPDGERLDPVPIDRASAARGPAR
jgi:hypothetical protein